MKKQIEYLILKMDVELISEEGYTLIKTEGIIQDPKKHEEFVKNLPQLVRDFKYKMVLIPKEEIENDPTLH